MGSSYKVSVSYFEYEKFYNLWMQNYMKLTQKLKAFGFLNFQDVAESSKLLKSLLTATSYRRIIFLKPNTSQQNGMLNVF